MKSFEKSLKRKPRDVVNRARKIVERIRDGAKAHEVGAKRMNHARDRLSVAIGRSWRLVLREVDGVLEPLALMSHETYNGTKPASKR